MERNYIVLKRPHVQFSHGAMDDVPHLGTSTGRPPLEVEFATMASRQAHDLARAPEVWSIVREIPLKLVQPLADVAASPELADSGVAWGIRAIGAVDSQYCGLGVKVAVLDTGIDSQHDAFAGMDLTEVDYTGEGNGDTHGHGTHCAATIFGRDVNGVRMGVARGIGQAFIGKVIGRSGGGTPQLLRAVLDAVEQGCQVISMSLGFDYPGLVARLQREDGLPAELAIAIALADYRANTRVFDRVGELIRARSSMGPDVLLLAAAGNESRRDKDPIFEMPAMPPGEAEGFTSVGALGPRPDGALGVAPFSNNGCRIAAPGVAVLSAKAGSRHDLIPLSGTSMATAHVAGMAALLLERSRPLRTGRSLFRPRSPSGLDLILGAATTQPLEPSFTAAQVGLGLVRAPSTP